MQARRKMKVAVVSDVHLGTYGCQAEALLKYLRSIDPEVLVLNGDVLDIWQLSKRYFPASHWSVVKELMSMVDRGVETFYITGNHDETMRKFVDTHFGRLHIVNKVVLELDGKKAWFFHGDVFDVTMQHSKWLAKMGAHGYALLILLNRSVNFMLQLFGKRKISLSRRIKQEVSHALKSKSNFEQTAADIAIEKGYEYVVCGHIHQAAIKRMQNQHGVATYLNSGDWVESLTALEYNKEGWMLYEYMKDEDLLHRPFEEEAPGLSNKALFEVLQRELL
jgi:UDP-2,3-diacylglucosamine pyrophosphatase LpxH